MSTKKFVAVIRKEESTSFGGEILGLNCFFSGNSLEEALINGLDALKEHLTLLEEEKTLSDNEEVFQEKMSPLLVELDLSDVVCLKILEI